MTRKFSPIYIAHEKRKNANAKVVYFRGFQGYNVLRFMLRSTLQLLEPSNGNIFISQACFEHAFPKLVFLILPHTVHGYRLIRTNNIK